MKFFKFKTWAFFTVLVAFLLANTTFAQSGGSGVEGGGILAWECYTKKNLAIVFDAGCEVWSPNASLYHLVTWVDKDDEFAYCYGGSPFYRSVDGFGDMLVTPYTSSHTEVSWWHDASLYWSRVKIVSGQAEWSHSSSLSPMYYGSRGPFTNSHNGC